MRSDRRSDQLRSTTILRPFTKTAAGSVLIQAGRTTVLCTASVEPRVPDWLLGKGRGWITAEYSMLPGSTSPRKPRDRSGRVDGRTYEIQRLIGRSLRAVADLAALGERTIAIDCDVLEADGGTRTWSITAGLIALADALRSIRDELPDPARNPLREMVAAVSVGLLDGQTLLDLDYAEDSAAAVDMNVVMTSSGQLVEVQGTGERATFSQDELLALLASARSGLGKLFELQRNTLGDVWPLNAVV
jgi:ribonuclease PH